MKRMNVIAVFDKDIKNTLMCKRTKEPYKGMFNFVGGKLKNDNDLEEAYRELFEETNIDKKDIEIIHLMDIFYYRKDFELEIYYGILKHDVKLIEEVNKLVWISLDDNFFDLNKYAGKGNIGHIMEQIKIDIKNTYK